MIGREAAAAARRGVGLFRSLARGVIAVTGADATRWLNGMVSNDVARLTAGSSRSGCYATLLTPQGRIVADLQVLLRADGFWLDVAVGAVPAVMARLGGPRAWEETRYLAWDFFGRRRRLAIG